MRKARAYHEERVGGLDEAFLLVLELLELRRWVEQVDVVLQHLFQSPPHKKNRSVAKNRIGSVDPHDKSGSKQEGRGGMNESAYHLGEARGGGLGCSRAMERSRERRRRGESGALGLEGSL
jgi:hypothetical protein